MATQVRSFQLPKRGHSPAECDDACQADAARGRFAVADGASGSVYSAVWSRLLVDHFVSSEVRDFEEWTNWLPAVQQSWSASFRDRTIPWYAEEPLKRGSFATFLGVALAPAPYPEGAWRWRAVAVGDACLFHTRGAELLSAFPLRRADAFNNYPTLLGSLTAPEEVRDKRACRAQDTCRAHDRLWLMTDALAQWLLAEYEAGGQPWQDLAPFLAEPDQSPRFEARIEELRVAKRLRNDDVALVAVEVL